MVEKMSPIELRKDFDDASAPGELECGIAQRLIDISPNECDAVPSIVIAEGGARTSRCRCAGSARSDAVMEHSHHLYRTVSYERERFETQDSYYDRAIGVLAVELATRMKEAKLVDGTADADELARHYAPHIDAVVERLERQSFDFDAHRRKRRRSTLRSTTRRADTLDGALQLARRISQVRMARMEAYQVACDNMKYLYSRLVQHFTCHFNLWRLASIDNCFEAHQDTHCVICTETFVNTHASTRNRLVLHCCDFKQSMCITCFARTAYSGSLCGRRETFCCAFCKKELPLYN